MSFSYSFSHAICRRPGASATHGLRAVDTGTPDIDLFIQHHDDYVSALKSTGAHVIELAADETFPDGCFVEDAALCLPELAIVMRPGTSSRLGEAALMKPELEKHYQSVAEITRGHIEGGDILVTDREILIGSSDRTDQEGVENLREIVAPYGYMIRMVQTPPGVLHFKTDCSLLDEHTILSTKRLADSGCFEGYNVIHVADGEEACANTIRFNDLVIMPAGFPKTRAVLTRAGFSIREVGNSEAARLDGGMSCLSLRFSPPAT